MPGAASGRSNGLAVFFLLGREEKLFASEFSCTGLTVLIIWE